MVDISNSIDVQGGPISLVFSAGGRVFFSERITGNIWEIIGEKNYKLIKHLPVVQATGHHEAGVLGITLDPDFEKNGYIYSYFTEGPDIDHASNKVVRFIVDSDSKEEVLLSKIPGGVIHNGGIICFGPDGKLYVGIGIKNSIKDKSQDKSYLGGKIVRLNSNGSIPSDNPFPGSPVYSFGHRNIFGLAFHPRTGKLYICDVGPDSDDEIDIVKPGGNFGWPKVAGYTNNKNFIDPIITYTPTITPTQSFFLGDDLYFGSYNDGNVHKLVLSEDGTKVKTDTIVYQGDPFGITGVFKRPNGEFFVTTTNKILKVKFKKGEVNKMKNKTIIWALVIVAIVAIGVGAYFVVSGLNKNSSTNNTNNSNNSNSNNTNNQVIPKDTVLIQNLAFNPGTITVSVGDTVTWRNDDSTIHHIVADDASFDLGDVSSGGTSTHTFTTAGSYSYHCSIHTFMTGIIIVQ